MSNSKKPPPPDDFSKTTPNINLPDDDDTSSWDKTDYRYPAQPPTDDWGDTVNFNTEEDSFSGGSGDPKVPDWGITRADVSIDPDDYASESSGYEEDDFGKTTPYFKLPQADREKYQKTRPTPSEEKAKKKEEEEKKGGVPTWLWVSGALLTMFFFVLIAFGIIFFFMTDPGFKVIVTDVPAGSQIFINDSPWGETTSTSGERELPILKAGETKRIRIVNPNYECTENTVIGDDGDVQRIKANCTKSTKEGQEIDKDCLTFKVGEYEKARQCAYEQLTKLNDPPDIDALLRAMNIYINHFDSGSDKIREVDRKFLETAAGYIKKVPEEIPIEVGGHTDSDGSDPDNQDLSERRAKAVRDELIKAGVKESMLTMKGYGEKCPKTTNATPDGKFQNRRIFYQRASKSGCNLK